MTTKSAIPDSIRPIVSIGTVLPPFGLIILVFLWLRLNSNTSLVLQYLAYGSLSLLPLALGAWIRRAYKGMVLPGGGRAWASGLWLMAVAPLFGTMATMSKADLQLTIALPVVLISGFFLSSVVYLVTAVVTVELQKKRNAKKARFLAARDVEAGRAASAPASAPIV